MATLTIPEKTTVEEHRHPADSQVGLLTREKVANIEWDAAVIVAPAQPTTAPLLPRRQSLMARIMRPVLSLIHEISGPPMTELDRRVRDLAETRFQRYACLGGF